MKAKAAFLFLVFLAPALYAQEITWRTPGAESVKQIAGLSLGADYTTNYSFTYAHTFGRRLPLAVGGEFYVPFGRRLLDDFRLTGTVQTELWHNEHLSWVVKPGLSFRRYWSTVAKIEGVSANINTSFGYYKRSWGAAVDITYDRILASYILHHSLKEYYPEIRDGWYKSSGGNFQFGIKANYNFGRVSILLKTGAMFGQNFTDNPTLPFYANMGAVLKL